MESKAKWGPWRAHSGVYCPVASGTIVEVCVVDQFGRERHCIGKVRGGRNSSWNWANYPEYQKVTRYRIKRPKGVGPLVEALEAL